MKRAFGSISVAVAIGLACVSVARAQSERPTEKAIQLVNQGKVERGIEVLRAHLRAGSKDIEARVVLGQILDFDGKPDDAIRLLQEGLAGGHADFPLLMEIGALRQRQGESGPLISHARGTVTARPSQNAVEEQRQQDAWLAEAAAAYEKALKLRRDDLDATRALAKVYGLQKKPEAAAALWKSLITAEPKKGEYHYSLAIALKEARRTDEAIKALERCLELNSRFAPAYRALADLQKQQGRNAEAAQSEAQANFYERLPSFVAIDYSTEHAKMLESLDDAAAVRKLIEDPSELAAQFLAVVCWSHPHNALESQAFDALEARGAKTTALLWDLLGDAHSTCTIRSTAHILARRKAEGLFDFLAERLPGDLRTFGMDMDIAGSLDDLGDVRAVGPLIQMLDPAADDHKEGENQGDILSDRISARRRAALALGAFDTPESRKALQQATNQELLAPFCFAALYRLNREPKTLAALDDAVAADDRYASYLIGSYLLRTASTPESQQLAARWEKQRAEHDTKERAKRKAEDDRDANRGRSK